MNYCKCKCSCQNKPLSPDAIKRIEAARQAALISRDRSDKLCQYFAQEEIKYQKSMDRVPVYFVVVMFLIFGLSFFL
jgi:hypothetical protein